MPEKLAVTRISDCSNHFKGQIKAGTMKVEVPESLKKSRCYYQHDWIFCVCNNTYCNSPQYWPLMFARFFHESPPATRRLPGAFADAKKMIKEHGLNVTINKNEKKSFRENLRCFVWFSDTVNQEELNPPFYLYNYITTVHRAPPLADALTTDPALRKDSDWGTIQDHTVTKLHIPEKEPYEDGTHETDPDYKTYPHEMKQDQENSERAVTFLSIGLAVCIVAFGGTNFFLYKICQRIRDHSQFTRVDDRRARGRYTRCFKTPKLPTEFVKISGKELKNVDMEAGPSVK
ncbi:hypothetical protein CRE_26119 [Caenorhabditis remanei]|uniref:Uncharacterized protein n=1 Tax=Caenorhabditis remanei TaxID=31234 RepID=E3LQA2_CAERE|nr:hypothetical protein CRE_26119 [Caenorhabditis remanei]